MKAAGFLKRAAAAAILMHVLAVPPATAADPYAFKWRRPLVPPGGGGSGVGTITLDEDFLGEFADDAANFRVFTADGTEVPHIFRTAKGIKVTEVFKPVEMAMLDWQTHGDGKQELVVERKDRTAPFTHLAVYPEGTPLWKMVAVYGSSDCVEWRHLTGLQPVYDLAAQGGPSQTVLAVASNEYGFLKVQVENMPDETRRSLAGLVRMVAGTTPDGGGTPLRNEQLRFCLRGETGEIVDGSDREYAARIVDVAKDEAAGSATVTFEAGRVPVLRVAVVADLPEFMWSARLECPDGPDAWKQVGEGAVYRTRAGGPVHEDLQLTMPRPRRAARYRLVLTGAPGAAPDVKGVRLFGHSVNVLFLSGAGVPLVACYGGDVKDLPVFPAERTAEIEQAGLDLAKWTAGPAEPNVRPGPRIDPVKDAASSNAVPVAPAVSNAPPVVDKGLTASEPSVESPSAPEPRRRPVSLALVLAGIAMLGTLVWIIDKALDSGGREGKFEERDGASGKTPDEQAGPKKL